MHSPGWGYRAHCPVWNGRSFCSRKPSLEPGSPNLAWVLSGSVPLKPMATVSDGELSRALGEARVFCNMDPKINI